MNKQDKYKLVLEDYNAIAGWYNSTYDAAVEMKKYLNNFIKDLGVGQKILDAGCGPGKESGFLSPNYDVTAVDLSPNMIELVKKNFPLVRAQVGNITQLAFNNDSFDAIWTSRTIIHIPREDLGLVLQEFNRVLKKDGILGLVTLSPVDKSDHQEQFLPEEDGADDSGKLTYYRNLYSYDLISAELTRAKFKITDRIIRKMSKLEPHYYIKALKL